MTGPHVTTRAPARERGPVGQAFEEIAQWAHETDTVLALVLVGVGAVGWIAAGLVVVLGAW